MVLIHVHLERPEDQLIQDPYLKSWMRDYTLAYCKKMLGEARSKFSALPGARRRFIKWRCNETRGRCSA